MVKASEILPAGPDDPIFKKGLTIYTPPSARPKPTPPSARPKPTPQPPTDVEEEQVQED